MNNQNFVVLPEILLERYGYKNSLAICLVLKNKLLDGSCILQFEDIYEQLGYYRQHRQYSQVRQLFINMQKDKLLHCDYNLEEVNNHKLLRVTLFSEGKFIKIPYGDIEKILQYPEKINLFSVYVVIKKHLWEEDSTWDVSYEEIKKYTGIKHNKTIEKYLEILENLQLITKTPSNYKNNNHKPCYTFSLLKNEDKEEISIEPPRQQQPPRQQSTAENNNPSFSVVFQKEKERTTTSNAGRVLTEGDKNISPPTPPTTTQTPPQKTQTTTPQQQTTTPTLQTTQATPQMLEGLDFGAESFENISTTEPPQQEEKQEEKPLCQRFREVIEQYAPEKLKELNENPDGFIWLKEEIVAKMDWESREIYRKYEEQVVPF